MVSYPAVPPAPMRGFSDGLGQRVVTWTASGPVEALRLSAALCAGPGFEQGVRDALDALAGFSHPAFREAPRLERLSANDGRPVLVSPYTAGRRLTDLLRDAQALGRAFTTSTSLFVVRETLQAVQALHQAAPGTFHGALGPERVFVTPDLRVLVIEHVLGRALAATLPSDPVELWRRFGLAVPADPLSLSFGPETDQLQIGLITLALLLGRPLDLDDYPDRIPELFDEAHERDLLGRPLPLGPVFREWLARLLSISMNGPYPDLAAAAADLGILLSDDGGYVAAPLGLEVKPEALQELPSRHAQRPAMISALPRSSQPAPLPVGPPRDPPSEAPTLEADGSATPPATEAPVTPVLRASGSSPQEQPGAASGPPSLLDLSDTEVEDAMSAFVSEADTAVRHGTPTLTLHVKPEPHSDAAPDVAPAAEEPAAEDPAAEEPAAEDCGPQPDVSDGVVDRSAGVLSVVVPREVGALEPVPPALNADPAHASRPAAWGGLAILKLPKGILEPAGHEESDHLSATTPEPTLPGRSQEGREETDRASRPAARLRRLPRRLVILVASLGILLTAGLVAGGYYIVKGADRPGRLRLESTPNGATVVREGRNLGTTPLVVDLPPGAHFLEIRGRYSTYTLAVSVRPRGEVHESVKLPEAGAPGELRVSTQPPGARVSVDGKERGLAPLTLKVPPGLHRISASNGVGSAEREVIVPTARSTAVQLPISGWIDASSPVPVRMTISGRPTGLGRVALPPGRYRVEFVNDEVAFHDLQEVVVEAGKAVAITPGGLTAMLDVTSDAPADVVVDGRAVGRTPISNLSLPIGKHDVRFATNGVGEVRYEIVLGPGSNRLHGTVASAAPTKAVAVPQNRLPRAPRPR